MNVRSVMLRDGTFSPLYTIAFSLYKCSGPVFFHAAFYTALSCKGEVKASSWKETGISLYKMLLRPSHSGCMEASALAFGKQRSVEKPITNIRRSEPIIIALINVLIHRA